MSIATRSPHWAHLLIIVLLLTAGAVFLGSGFGAAVPPAAVVTAGGPTATDTPLPAMTPLPFASSNEHWEGVPLETGTGAEPHVRTLALAPDDSGDVVFTVGKTYPHQRALFRMVGDRAEIFAPPPETASGFREILAVPDGYIVGTAAWDEDGGNEFAYHALYAVSAVGSTLKRLTDERVRLNDYVASADGATIIMLLNDGRLEALDRASGVTRTLATDLVSPAGVAAATMAVSPDGELLIVGSHPAPSEALLERITMADGQREVLARWPGQHQAMPVFLPDGRLRLIVHQEQKGSVSTSGSFGYRTQLYDVDPDEGAPMLLADLTPSTGAGDIVRHIVALPDGRLLYRQDGTLWLMSADGGGRIALKAVEGFVTAGPVVGTVGGVDRVAWVERTEVASNTVDQPLTGGPAPVEYSVRMVDVP